MTRQIYVNLPIGDLDSSVKFFSALGFGFNPQFTDKNATCMIVGEDSFVMLLVKDFFSTFTPKEISDATKTTEVLLAVSCESKDAVNEMVDKAIEAGGTETREPQDHGFMFARSFNDLDGHIWEIMWMDESAMTEQTN
ncbi:MAG: VOC family protein [Pyrinomonadaceae bacterium]